MPSLAAIGLVERFYVLLRMMLDALLWAVLTLSFLLQLRRHFTFLCARREVRRRAHCRVEPGNRKERLTSPPSSVELFYPTGLTDTAVVERFLELQDTRFYSFGLCFAVN